ncbi:MAG: hypothetical protein ACRDT8_10310, partial [Micromonosporaceae bacterium]
WLEKAFSRGAYRSQGAAWLPLRAAVRQDSPDGSGNGRGVPPHQAGLEVELTPVTSRQGRRVDGAPVTVRLTRRTHAWYEVTRAGPPWRRELRVSVHADQRAELRRLIVVLRRGAVMPLHAQDGEVLRQLDHVTLTPHQPTELRVPAPHGPYWLRCFSADDSIELRDPPVTQLRGGR